MAQHATTGAQRGALGGLDSSLGNKKTTWLLMFMVVLITLLGAWHDTTSCCWSKFTMTTMHQCLFSLVMR